MSISRARTIAFDILVRVANQGAYADEALRTELETNVRSEDAGLATELVLGVLRWQRLLDFIIDQSLRKSSHALDIEVRVALRMGAYQILYLDRIPAHAAVHESVELVKRARKSSAASLVNAILRKIDTEQSWGNFANNSISLLIPENFSLAERMGIQYSHPTWMVERWLRIFGEDRTRALHGTNNRAPITSGYLLDSERREDAVASLRDLGCHVRLGRLLRDAWVFEGGNPSASEAVRRGWVVIQDEASQAVAHLVGVQPGDRVLDLCAAPGGKTLLLARAAGEQGHVIAADLYEHRVRSMKERFEQAGVRNVETMTLDAAQPLPFDRPFERILVDVPCSGTGTLARHPEIRWKLRAEDLSDLHDRQVRLLRNALPHLAEGGHLVFSTCSLEPEENEDVVEEALKDLDGGFHLVSARGGIEGLLQDSSEVISVVSADGFFRTFPPETGTDGFFAAVIERGNSKA
jgi:16S rRNA (cytosine967-C5)-methyltransferase